MKLNKILPVLIVLLIFGFIGCKKPVDLKFNHKLHVVENEIECDTCHKIDDDGNMQNPDMDTCSDCHDIGDVDNPTKDCLMCHTPEGAKKDYAVEKTVKEKPESYADVQFTHEPHSDYECSKCHGDINKNVNLMKIKWPKMNLCMQCHNGDTAPKECETCHSKIKKEKAPESHHKDWEARHGYESKFTSSCNYCHNKNFCQDCHQTKKPKDHIFNWKTTQHGMEAIKERRKCAVCHVAAFCSDCHKSQKPVSHKRADWVKFKPEPGHAEEAMKNFRSCNVCHTTSDCDKCHTNIILYRKKR